jgi:predicted RNA-binding protein with PIN domain
MPYLIDGHNLIPKLGLRLDSMDDELELVAILQEFCRLERRQVEVYFDGAPAGHAGTRSLGAVKAHFVRLGHSADKAIRTRLIKMGKDTKNWSVVSSDRQVQTDALSLRAQTISSEEFAKLLAHARSSAPEREPSQSGLSSTEVNEWLDIFNSEKK